MSVDPSRRRASRLTIGSVAVTLVAAVLAACAAPSEVAVERSRDLGDVPGPTGPTTDPSTDPTTDPGTDPTTEPTTDPGTDPTTEPSTDPSNGPRPTDPTTGPTTTPIRDIIDEGADKPDRPYDDLVEAAVADLENMWTVMYPALYGEAYEPLEGGVWPVYPGRQDRVPGCGTSETTYPQVQSFAAFYCQLGDFIAFDDGPDGIFGQIIEDLGPEIVPVVLAHEWGHAIQERNGDFNRGLPTIVTEQQADCFSGAWSARAQRGEVPGLQFTDREVKIGLSALLAVRDPIDTSPQQPGAHGSGFDRVGAFQVGYLSGFTRCAELIAEPLPLVPNEFLPNDTDGNPNAPFDDTPGQEPPDGIFSIVEADLNEYWTLVFSSTETPFAELSVEAAADPSNVDCDDLTSVERGAGYCAANRIVYYDEEFMRELYDQFGDFSVGYVIATAWSDAAQSLLESPFTDEPRSLLNDCLTGSWVSTILPGPDGEVTPDRAVIEPGDLDEAIQTALLIGDENSDVNEVGTAFEKIDYFRDGALNGLEACSDRIPD